MVPPSYNDCIRCNSDDEISKTQIQGPASETDSLVEIE